MTSFFVHEIACGDPWFYCVTAVNRRGTGNFRVVWFFQRHGHGRRLLMPVMVRPGLRVTICQLGP